MNKKLPTAGIANELAGSSVFFQSQNEPKAPPRAQRPKPPSQVAQSQPSMETSHQDVVTPRHHDTTQPTTQETKQAASREDAAAAMLETIRKAVRQIGKEAATHRFTAEEKVALADIVYTYTRLGYKTSENEITRIAVNWLLLDYQERGDHSVLARMLESIHR